MSLIRYNPFTPTKNFGSFFEDFFNRTIGDFVGFDHPSSTPHVNVFEEDDHFKLEVAAPGLEKENFEINVENNFLHISAEREVKKEVEEEKFTRREFNYTSFKRSFRLPETVNADKIAANYENGVLTVTLPKKEIVKAKPSKTIRIK